MINKFFTDLQLFLEALLPWVEIVGRNVTYVNGENGLFPVQCYDGDCKEPETHLIPSGNKSSILFFELKSIKDLTKNDPCVQIFQIKFDLFFWYNCDKIKVEVDGQEINCCEKIDYLHQEIIKAIKQFMGNPQYIGTAFNVSKPFIKTPLLCHPYYNFNISLQANVEVNNCDETTGSEPTITITNEDC